MDRSVYKDDTPITLTLGEIKELMIDLLEARDSNNAHSQYSHDRGIAVICELFSVSYPTAHKYRKTFLAPACSCQGRVIIVDKEMAVKLFSEHKNTRKKCTH